HTEIAIIPREDGNGDPALYPEFDMQDVNCQRDSTIAGNIQSDPPMTLGWSSSNYFESFPGISPAPPLAEGYQRVNIVQPPQSFDRPNFSPREAASSVESANSLQNAHERSPVRNLFGRR